MLCFIRFVFFFSFGLYVAEFVFVVGDLIPENTLETAKLPKIANAMDTTVTQSNRNSQLKNETKNVDTRLKPFVEFGKIMFH